MNGDKAESKQVAILVVGSLLPGVEQNLTRSFDVRREMDADVRGVVVSGSHMPIDDAFAERLPRLEIVSTNGVGYDHIDVAGLLKRGVVLTHTPDVLTNEVADLVLGLLLATVRQLPQADLHVRAGRWLNAPFPLSPTLRGRRIGILGLGRIGKAVAKRLAAFDVEIEYHGRRPQPDVKHRYHSTLLGLAKSCDVLIVTASGGASTARMVNREVLDALGPSGILISAGRGTIVDEDALVQALIDKRILSAGLDVFEDEPRVRPELISMEHVVLLPHVGSGSAHTRDAMGQLMIDNLVSWFAGKGAITPVPECRELGLSRAAVKV